MEKQDVKSEFTENDILNAVAAEAHLRARKLFKPGSPGFASANDVVEQVAACYPPEVKRVCDVVLLRARQIVSCEDTVEVLTEALMGVDDAVKEAREYGDLVFIDGETRLTPRAATALASRSQTPV